MDLRALTSESERLTSCQETRTLVIFFSYFLTYRHSLLSIPHYIPPLCAAW